MSYCHKTFCICKYLYHELISNICICKVMLMKSFVTVAVTTSYRNRNWELKIRREGNDTDSKFWNQGSGMINSKIYLRQQ